MVRITYHTLSNWFWKKLQAGNQAEMLHPGIAMVIKNSSWLKFFKNFYEISIPWVSFMGIDRLLDKNGKNSVFYTKIRRVLEESRIIAPDKAAYCVFTQFREPENEIKFISVRTKTQ